MVVIIYMMYGVTIEVMKTDHMPEAIYHILPHVYGE